jgi:hypothetical protein
MRVLKGMFKSESGQVLPIALVLLVLGAFLVIPVISLMTTNLNANRQVDQANLETYAADAGVENIIWEMAQDPGLLPAEGETNQKTVNIDEQTMNGMSTVTTTITNVGHRFYRVNSIATHPDGHNTEIEAYINCLNFANLLKGAITSNGGVEIRNAVVDGMVFYNTTETINNSELIPAANNPQQATQTNWPTWDDLQPLYWSQVENEPPFNQNSIQAENYPNLGPICVAGNGNLTIDCNTAGAKVTVNKTIYVPGDLTFNQSGSKNYILDMNDGTLFVGGNISMPSHRIDIIGSGCIIARHDILFQPGTEAGSPDDYVLVLSLEGTTTMQPSGNFYGSLVGSSTVELQPGGYLEYTDPFEHDLNFPGLTIGGEVPFSGEGTVVSYTIK